MAVLVGTGRVASCCLVTTGRVDGGVCSGLLLGDFCTGVFAFGVGTFKRTTYFKSFPAKSI